MLFSTISPSGSPLQLPGLSVGDLSTKYFDLINMFYETSLSADDYKTTQVFLNADGKPELELVPNQINSQNDILFFVSRSSSGSSNTDTQTVDNPLANMMSSFLKSSPVWVISEKECAFLAALPLNTPRNIFALGDGVPAQLALMLNGVDGQPNWSVNPDATYSVAGFSVEYYGPISTASDEYFYPDQATTVAIINILQGGYLGKLMVCVK